MPPKGERPFRVLGFADVWTAQMIIGRQPGGEVFLLSLSLREHITHDCSRTVACFQRSRVLVKLLAQLRTLALVS